MPAADSRLMPAARCWGRHNGFQTAGSQTEAGRGKRFPPDPRPWPGVGGKPTPSSHLKAGWKRVQILADSRRLALLCSGLPGFPQKSVCQDEQMFNSVSWKMRGREGRKEGESKRMKKDGGGEGLVLSHALTLPNCL